MSLHMIRELKDFNFIKYKSMYTLIPNKINFSSPIRKDYYINENLLLIWDAKISINIDS